jgi:hypothetical protein
MGCFMGSFIALQHRPLNRNMEFKQYLVWFRPRLIVQK